MALALVGGLATLPACTRTKGTSQPPEPAPKVEAKVDDAKPDDAKPKNAPPQKSRAILAVGGTVGFESFADPASSQRLRATGKAVLYLHSYIWSSHISDATKRAVLKSFADTGPQVIEVGVG